MVGWIILAVLAILILLVFFLPYGVDVGYADEVLREYGISLQTINAAHPVDVLVVAVGHSAYRALTPEQLKTFTRGTQPILADIKSLYDRNAAAAAGFTVFRL